GGLPEDFAGVLVVSVEGPVGAGPDEDESAGGDGRSVAVDALGVAGVLDALGGERGDGAERNAPFDRALVEVVGDDLGPGRADGDHTVGVADDAFGRGRERCLIAAAASAAATSSAVEEEVHDLVELLFGDGVGLEAGHLALTGADGGADLLGSEFGAVEKGGVAVAALAVLGEGVVVAV